MMIKMAEKSRDEIREEKKDEDGNDEKVSSFVGLPLGVCFFDETKKKTFNVEHGLCIKR